MDLLGKGNGIDFIGGLELDGDGNRRNLVEGGLRERVQDKTIAMGGYFGVGEGGWLETYFSENFLNLRLTLARTPNNRRYRT